MIAESSKQKKLGLGANSSFNYKIDQDSGLSNANNIENEKYPIACYSSTTIQGMTFLKVIMMGGLTTTTLSDITSS
ncbi:MAG: hypothetical protein MJ223_00435 [Mycoplasmoidaceae bacterium]|nr:hypothetical protein [Mycoplasmoidaceae bacterium]